MNPNLVTGQSPTLLSPPALFPPQKSRNLDNLWINLLVADTLQAEFEHSRISRCGIETEVLNFLFF